MRAQIAIITIMTPNVAGMARFYTEVMGFKTIIVEEQYVEFEHESIRFSICGKVLMVDNTNGHPSYIEERKGQAFELCFQCDSPAETMQTYKDLVAKGA